MAPLRRKSRGAITPITEWLLYADNPVAPLRRQSCGALTPITEWLLNGGNSQLMAHRDIRQTQRYARHDLDLIDIELRYAHAMVFGTLEPKSIGQIKKEAILSRLRDIEAEIQMNEGMCRGNEC